MTGITTFGLELLKKCYRGNNTMVSPFSVLTVLNMVRDGASGSTLDSMSAVMGICKEDFQELADSLDVKQELSSANGVWINSNLGVTLKDMYLQTVTADYGAPVKASPFDEGTVREINAFVNGVTDGQIPTVLDELNPLQTSCLVNAVNFDGKWDKAFEDVSEGMFTRGDGSKAPTTMLYGDAMAYMEADGVKGFTKLYKGDNFVFGALLPDGDINDFIENLSGEQLQDILDSCFFTEVNVGVPKFETDFSEDLKEVLCAMGMENAFGDDADFSRMSESKFCLDSVIHKTHIKVDEKGTQAAAVTAGVMRMCCMPLVEPKTIILDRPFLYTIMDANSLVPVFIGIYTGIEG